MFQASLWQQEIICTWQNLNFSAVHLQRYGNLLFKSSVGETLYENFDAHSIAGTKLTELLPFQVDQTHTNTTMDTTREEPTTPKRPKKKKKIDHSPSSDRSLSPSPVKYAQSPPSLIRNITSPPKNKTIPSSRDLLSPGSQCVRAWATKRAEIASRRSSPSPPRSPPGFPNPKHSPSVNISSLHMLVAEKVGTAPGTHGPVFYPGHGPDLCFVHCNTGRPPSNCSYNDRWVLPVDFLMCRPSVDVSENTIDDDEATSFDNIFFD